MAAAPKWQLLQNGSLFQDDGSSKMQLFQNGGCSKMTAVPKIMAVPKWRQFQNGGSSKIAAVPQWRPFLSSLPKNPVASLRA